MNHNYTRQRQGRDFFNDSNAAEKSMDGSNAPPKDDYEQKKTMLEQLEYFQTIAERNATPVDGHEPTERGISL